MLSFVKLGFKLSLVKKRFVLLSSLVLSCQVKFCFVKLSCQVKLC